ncbi:ribonuclease domain-containing protein, partial [Streptomyces hygroscopicus]
MTIPPRIARIGAFGALVSTLIIGGTATVASAAAPPAPRTIASSQVIAAVGDICYSDLPSEAHDTLDLIEQGGPYPYPQDGTVFQNREGVLPSQSSGYYHEYTVITP